MSGLGTQPGSQSSETTAVDMSAKIQVNVDGVMTEMTIQEAANGYATQAKMTQATQRAAQLEAELGNYTKFWDQLQANPGAMIGELQTKFGIVPETPSNEDSLDDDPMSAEVTQLKQLIAEQSANMQALQGQVATQAQTQRMKSEIDGLRAQFGDAFKADEVATYATSKNISDLTTAFHAMRGEQALTDNPPPTPQTMSPVLPGSPVATNATIPPPQPAKSLAEALQRGYASTGQTVEITDLIPQQ